MGRKKADIGEFHDGQVLSGRLYQVTKWLTSAREIEFAIAQLKKYGTPCQLRIYRRTTSGKPINFAVFRQDDFEKAQAS